MTKLKDLKTRLLKDPAVRKEYDARGSGSDCLPTPLKDIPKKIARSPALWARLRNSVKKPRRGGA